MSRSYSSGFPHHLATTSSMVTSTGSLDILDRRHSLVENPSLSTPPQLDAISNPQFVNFSFPYQGGHSGEIKLENHQDSYGYSDVSPTDHRGSITSMSSAPRTGRQFGSVAQLGQARNSSLSGDSDDASSTSIRPGGSAFEGNYGDDFGLTNAGAGDGSDLGARMKEEKNGLVPPRSELKIKAGKERKRLSLACIACRRKKIRCSGEKPACKHCLRARIPCVYKVTTRKAGPRTDYMAMLDKRLERMEERIIKIVPKDEQDHTPSITRANVKPAIPGTIAVRTPAGKKRSADEAFGAELENWSKTSPNANIDTGSKPASLMRQEAEESKLLLEGAEALPPKEIQEHLAEVFFENLYGQAYHILHKPSFMRKLRAGTVPPVLILAVCAISARFSTHPKVSSTPSFLRGEEWASEARNIVMKRYDLPNFSILICLLMLGLHEFGTCQGGRSWSFGGQAIRMAYALQLHKELDYDPLKRNDSTQLSFIDREIRRRKMWACFFMDRFNSSGTDRPTFIKEDPIKEKLFQLDMPGPTENLAGENLHPVSPDDGQLSDAKENMGVAAFTVQSIALWGRIINYLNLGGKELDAHSIWQPESIAADLIKQTEAFIPSLPDPLKYSPENLHTHETEGLANQFLFLHISIQQNILFMNRFSVPGVPGNESEQMPKDFVAQAGAQAFEAANRISELLGRVKPISFLYHLPDTAPFSPALSTFLESFPKIVPLKQHRNKTLQQTSGTSLR